MSLSRRERGLLIQAFLLLPMVEVWLRILGFKRTMRFMEWAVSRRRNRGLAPAPGQVESTVQMVLMAARHGIHKASCLRRAIVAWFLLGRQGIQAELRIGVRKEDSDTFDAHAWVEYEGRVVADPEASQGRYEAFEPERPAW